MVCDGIGAFTYKDMWSKNGLIFYDRPDFVQKTAAKIIFSNNEIHIILKRKNLEM